MERFGRIALKTILWIIASIIFLVLLIVILIQVPSVQNFVKDKAVTFIQGKIHTPVKIGHISLGLPKLIVLEDVYFEDQHKDTLIAGEKLKLDISLLKLLSNKVEINEINLQGITTNISRGTDSVFNFDYITKAFAGEQKKEVKPTDTASTMKFSIDKIILDKINVSYKDKITGNDVKFILGHFDTRIKDFDMDKMKFTIPKINISDVDARIIQSPITSDDTRVVPVDTTTTPISMTLKLGTIDVSKVKVDYRSKEMSSKVNLGKFLMVMDKIDLKNQVIGIKNITLDDTKAGITFAKPESVKKEVVKAVKKLDTLVATPTSGKGWRAKLAKVSFSNDNIQFDNDAQKALPKGLDFAHMDIKNLNADVEDISYSLDTISGKVNSFTFAEKSGLIIQKFHTSFLYGPKSAYLNDLLVETPQTVLQKQLQVSYPSIASITKDIGQLYVNANLDGSKLGLKDVLLLMPTMASMEPFKHSPNAVFRIDGRVIGNVNNLSIPNFEVKGLSNTHIKASANMRGLPNMNKAYFDVTIADLTTSRADISKLVAASMIPASVSIPANLNLKGTFKGSMYTFNTKMNLRSTYGAVDLVAAMKNGNNKATASYSANIKANNLNVGALTKQPQTVGSITLTATIKGAGLDPKKANLQFSGNVVKAYVKGYTYQNLVMTGTAHDGNYTAKANMKDPNINFTLDGKADMNKKYPSVAATLQLDSINLKNLNFTKDDMRIHGKIVADVPTADPDYLNANIKVTDFLLAQKDQTIKLDTISLVSTANADSSTLRLKAPMLNAHMAGKYKLTEVAPAMQDLINKYYNTTVASNKTVVKYSPQQFKFDIRVVKTPLTDKLVPDLKTLDPVLISGNFDSEAGVLDINGSMPKVVYGTNVVNNMKLAINTNNNALNYSLTADDIKASSSINLLYTSVTGSAQNNKLNINLQIRDAAKKERYRLAGVFSVLPDEYQFNFLQDGLILNYTQWAVNANNAFQFGNKGIMARDFTLTNNNQVLSINSDTQEYNAPITVSFKNFKIETLTTAAQQDSLQVGGVIDGDTHISNFQKSPVFTAALNVKDFNFKGDTVGNIALKVNNQTANAYAADVTVTGKGNQVNLNGLYYTAPESKFDLNLNIVSLKMKSIEGFSFGSIRRASGDITGQLKITGTTDAPVVRGDVNFNKVGFNVSMLNSYFTMPNEKITFNNDGILFDDFTLIDSLGNKAIVTGTLYTKTFTDFKFGIDINATNFRAINSTQEDNRLYYGKLFIDTRITIRGNMAKPVVDANLTVNDKTDLTIVLPQDDPGIEDRKGVVEVINPNAPKLDSIFLAKQLDSLRKSDVTGLDATANINVNKNAKFTIVIDERNGDVVHLQGEAHLNGGIDPSGKINLTGKYTVASGSYNLAYATVKRKFNFKPGSTINWTGDPTSANVDLTAIYVANVPPIDLVSDQLGGDQTTTTMYKQKLPFNVNLRLQNELLKPDISFDIVLPDSSYTVSPDVVSTVNQRLSQIRTDPNEMNKQVLGVLVLGHFIGDNPFQSQGGNAGIGGAIRNSVSSLLSDQLNKLAGNLIGGVQLSFDLTSGQDYSTGTEQNRTDLNVGLSKQFLNDRLTVTVGNNFNLEGQNQPGQKSTDIAGNVSVNYKITKDGRYMVRVYRKDEFIVVEGEVIETGIGFTLTYEYNRFKELFAKKSKKDKQLEKEYNEKQKAIKNEQKAADKKVDSTAAPVQPVQNNKPQN
ncbi:translocation/assembly module TamB domain-containing protein [Mucilaginibacter sp. BJC16-A38]|uniref:translocation/assembly module TamB domain-containing protein n=1 Tax=Mucilaginibacter phenanthrenivorans TaxID=1234842 RepID=UPI002157C89C|nr:translocation/assembly module TamB domain-containing protein [Mucilaginibacter phenanthrenivorans]MCR8559759.1 translocation/assembly module TamB domain-containing protein [Mucilaginibacter phenanthrenivorans]